MSRKSRLGDAKTALERQSERLKRDSAFPASLLLLPFVAVTVLTLYTSLEVNRKLFSNARPIDRAGPLAEEKQVWLSVGIRKNQIVITTPDGQLFSWPVTGPSSSELALLETYLKRRAREVVADAVRRGQLDGNRNVAALSVDQSLTYQHVRPIIYALGGAGFSRYGFETRVVR